MLKKVILGIMAAVLLLGAENLLAQEREADERAEKRALRRAERAERRVFRRPERVGRETGHKRMEGKQQKQKSLRHKQARPIQKRFDKWFRKLTKAYRQNNREKMGQLLRNMHQFREGQTKAKGELGERRQAPATPVARRGYGQDFHGRAGARKRRAGQFCGGPSRWDQGMPRRGMARWGRGIQQRGMMMHRRDMMSRRGRGLPPRGIGRWKQGMPERDFNWDW